MRQALEGLILKELALNGIHLDETLGLASGEVLSELTSTLTPGLHESRISSFGVIFADSDLLPVEARKLPLGHEHLSLARRLADGDRSFLLYEKARFYGLVFFPNSRATELELVRLISLLGGMIVQRNSDGVTKFFRNSGIVTHSNRSWFTKPHVREAARRTIQCVPGISRPVLNRILDLAFHILSPALHTGATLVWHLRPTGAEESPVLNLSIMDERDAIAVCHLLSQIDGAAVLDHQGGLLQTGVHLKSSAKAAALIREYKGTRHTSAQRFSYDHSETLVITVSEDGPVTIFSDGASIADLRTRSAEQEANVLRDIAPDRGNDVGNRAFEVECSTCQKTSLIEEVNVADYKERRSVGCPVCGDHLYSTECFALKSRPFKVLDRRTPHERPSSFSLR